MYLVPNRFEFILFVLDCPAQLGGSAAKQLLFGTAIGGVAAGAVIGPIDCTARFGQSAAHESWLYKSVLAGRGGSVKIKTHSLKTN